MPPPCGLGVAWVRGHACHDRCVLKHFALGPVVSRRLDEALSTAPLDRTRWQHGVAAAAKAFAESRSSYGALRVVMGAGLGVVAGAAVGGLPLALRFVVGALIGLGGVLGRADRVGRRCGSGRSLGPT